jgi:hypothetical protein
MLLMLRCEAGRDDSSAITQLKSRMSNALLLQADVTANTPEDKALLKRYGPFGHLLLAHRSFAHVQMEMPPMMS